MTPPAHRRPYDSVLDTIGWTPLIRLARIGAGHPDAGLRQGGVRQSRRVGEGPDRPRDHRGRGAAGRAQAGRHHRRGHQRQHRRRPGDRGGHQGLPLHLHHARTRCRRRRCACSRRYGAEVVIIPDRGAARPSRQLRHEGQADREGDAGRDPGQPVLQPGQSGGALRDDRPGDLGADRGARSPTSSPAPAPAAP